MLEFFCGVPRVFDDQNFPAENPLAAVIPKTTVDRYRWRGDLGLLDRLSYATLDQIPRNWDETLIDTAKIGLPSPNLTLALPAASRNPKHPLRDDIPNNHGEDDHSNHPIKKKRLFSLELCLSLTISTRVNKKPPQGNNRYDRNGTLKCQQCRIRKRKVPCS